MSTKTDLGWLKLNGFFLCANNINRQLGKAIKIAISFSVNFIELTFSWFVNWCCCCCCPTSIEGNQSKNS